ncbi:MAG: ATPase [Verrucomicrobia bacterium GWF2_51_19]|nr:MAG: ATPase [Verrucomicrobia bacterium GWF2_51_19]HCJ11651.1 ATPase [Opitutae bacterium]
MIERHITAVICESLKTFPVVLVTGARQAGKSTLANDLYEKGFLTEYVTLDDLSLLDAAKSSPESFIRQFTHPVIIDEIQRVPDLLIAIKRCVDENKMPGRFLLTGSANILAYPGVTESLAGRMAIVRVEGLSRMELKQDRYNFIQSCFEGDQQQILKDHLAQKKFTRTQLDEAVLYGGFPDVVLSQDGTFRSRWFSSYQMAYIERDARDLRQGIDILGFARLYKLIGLHSGNLLNVKNVAVEVGMDQRTIGRYLEVLEYTFQTNLLHPWYANIRKRLVKTPKVYLNDSGLACFLSGINTVEQVQQHPYYGALVETWLWSELRKWLHSTVGIEAFFYRTHQGKEIDFLFTSGNKVVGIECKAADRIASQDLIAFRELSACLGDTFRGFIFYLGEHVLSLENVVCVPFSLFFT